MREIVRRPRIMSWMTGLPQGYYVYCPVHAGGRITSKRKALKQLSRHHRKCVQVVTKEEQRRWRR
jgi:hypothetical protein